MKKNSLTKDTDKVINYLNKKNIWDSGFIRYSIFRKIIAYVCGIKTTYLIRKIFLYMVDHQLFIKQKTNKRSYLYKYKNPNEMKKITKSITITF